MSDSILERLRSSVFLEYPICTEAAEEIERLSTLVETATQNSECVHCGELLGNASLGDDTQHWKTCPNHPARAEIERLKKHHQDSFFKWWDHMQEQMHRHRDKEKKLTAERAERDEARRATLMAIADAMSKSAFLDECQVIVENAREGYHTSPEDIEWIIRQYSTIKKVHYVQSCLHDHLILRVKEIERELKAWRDTFPIMEVRPGAHFASTKLTLDR